MFHRGWSRRLSQTHSYHAPICILWVLSLFWEASMLGHGAGIGYIRAPAPGWAHRLFQSGDGADANTSLHRGSTKGKARKNCQIRKNAAYVKTSKRGPIDTTWVCDTCPSAQGLSGLRWFSWIVTITYSKWARYIRHEGRRLEVGTSEHE